MNAVAAKQKRNRAMPAAFKILTSFCSGSRRRVLPESTSTTRIGGGAESQSAPARECGWGTMRSGSTSEPLKPSTDRGRYTNPSWLAATKGIEQPREARENRLVHVRRRRGHEQLPANELVLVAVVG